MHIDTVKKKREKKIISYVEEKKKSSPKKIIVLHICFMLISFSLGWNYFLFPIDNRISSGYDDPLFRTVQCFVVRPNNEECCEGREKKNENGNIFECLVALKKKYAYCAIEYSDTLQNP